MNKIMVCWRKRDKTVRFTAADDNDYVWSFMGFGMDDKLFVENGLSDIRLILDALELLMFVRFRICSDKFRLDKNIVHWESVPRTKIPGSRLPKHKLVLKEEVI